MDPGPRGRRGSMEDPPDLSELKSKLRQLGSSFINEFDIKESEMRRIVDEIKETEEDLKVEQKKLDKIKRKGAALTGLGAVSGVAAIVGGVIAAPFTGGLSLALAAGAVCNAAVAGTAIGKGAETLIDAKNEKLAKEQHCVNMTELRGEIFQLCVKRLKKILEEIQTTCQRLEQRSTERKAKNTLRDMEKFEEILRRVSALKEGSEGAVIRETIRESAYQSQRVVYQLDWMKKELSDTVQLGPEQPEQSTSLRASLCAD
ncbi:uncharacterized protein LOC114443718 [Parambassis ranga]|uniref:Uncharacterized protein LOC114443718 n=1 Tax=Parambassis ranga TaxID=210632 RepID=A0A6P7JCU2_9TELE|nr:uncharacterized protein LOC114443718 [Parambassis ranga]